MGTASKRDPGERGFWPVEEVRYGKFSGEPSVAQLERFFHLDDFDRVCIQRHARGDENRLGFAAQVATVRFLGCFLADPTQVPPGALRHLSAQLGIYGRPKLKSYGIGNTHWRHSATIKEAYGYKNFAEMPHSLSFLRWVYSRLFVSEERSGVLMDLATAWLVERKVLLPGRTTLSRLIAKVRERVWARVSDRMAGMLSRSQGTGLETLLAPVRGRDLSQLEYVRTAPRWSSSHTLKLALLRLQELQNLGVGRIDLAVIPAGRLQAMFRYASTTNVSELKRLPLNRRRATLLAFAQEMELQATDDALQILEAQLLHLIVKKGPQRPGRAIAFKDWQKATSPLLVACEALLDEEVTDTDVRPLIFSKVTKSILAEVVENLRQLEEEQKGSHEKGVDAVYLSCQRFLAVLLQTIQFEASSVGRATLRAIEFLRAAPVRGVGRWSDAPTGHMNAKWKTIWNATESEKRRRVFTVCTLELLLEGLRRRELFVPRSRRWADPRKRLLDGEEWLAIRPRVLCALGWDMPAEAAIARIVEDLDRAYLDVLRAMKADPTVRIESKRGKRAFVVSRLEALPEKESLSALRSRIHQLLPRIQLPDALLEIDQKTGFLSSFEHFNQKKARVEEMSVSVCAVLIAQACNLEIETLVRSDYPPLSRARLSWVAQNYIRKDSIVRANAALVDYQSKVPLTRHWGGGDVASADGLRFVVPVRSFNTGLNPVYFGVGRGVTYYNFTSDQFTGFHGIVVPGTLHDSAYVLEGLLEQQTQLDPREIKTDTSGASEMVFGLFCLLGYQFSPRLADSGSGKFYRVKNGRCYGEIEKLNLGTAKPGQLEKQWEDCMRVAGSLSLNRISASELIHSLLTARRATSLGKAIVELGKISKTIHLLRYVSDQGYRRRILVQLNRGEQRHRLARRVFHGRRGELRQSYRQGQEDQLGALGLVVNALTLWNTLYMNQALNFLRSQDFPIEEADLSHLSPLEARSVNLSGTYSFHIPELVRKGEFRPLNHSGEP